MAFPDGDSEYQQIFEQGGSRKYLKPWREANDSFFIPASPQISPNFYAPLWKALSNYPKHHHSAFKRLCRAFSHFTDLSTGTAICSLNGPQKSLNTMYLLLPTSSNRVHNSLVEEISRVGASRRSLNDISPSFKVIRTYLGSQLPRISPFLRHSPSQEFTKSSLGSTCTPRMHSRAQYILQNMQQASLWLNAQIELLSSYSTFSSFCPVTSGLEQIFSFVIFSIGMLSKLRVVRRTTSSFRQLSPSFRSPEHSKRASSARIRKLSHSSTETFGLSGGAPLPSTTPQWISSSTTIPLIQCCKLSSIIDQSSFLTPSEFLPPQVLDVLFLRHFLLLPSNALFLRPRRCQFQHLRLLRLLTFYSFHPAGADLTDSNFAFWAWAHESRRTSGNFGRRMNRFHKPRPNFCDRLII